MKYSNAALFVLISLSASIAVADATCFPDRGTLNTAINAAVTGGASGAGYNDVTYGPIENWCFDSSLTDFSNLFSFKSTFNADISGWNVSSVTSVVLLLLDLKFYSASAFNQNIGVWDVSSVKDMSYMEMFVSHSTPVLLLLDHKFFYGSAFNQNIGGWNVSSVTDMAFMFLNGSTFNQDIGGWNVSSVTDMQYMFKLASAFNQDIVGWDVSSVTDMSNMFDSASAFNQDLCPWGPKIFDGSPPTVTDLFVNSGCPNTNDPVDGTNGSLPQNLCTTDICVPPSTTNSGGDPHFIGFNQKLITYQGECTLILLDSPAATATGEDVIIHVRTTRKFDFSYISGVAMKIGSNVVEIKPNADILLNGITIIGDEESTVSGVSFTFNKEEKGTKKMIVSYSFDIGNGCNIDVQANKKRGMMFVRTKGVFPAETVGMLGSPGKGEMVSRDGRLLMSDIKVNEYGESWQVKDTDVQLFQQPLGPQYPEKCLYEDAPGATAQLRGRRKLMTKNIVTVEEARKACATVVGMKNALCIQDSIAMGDLDLKNDPFYLEL